MSQPKRYRKRPVVVEAMQYTRRSRTAVMRWCGARGTAIDEDGAAYETAALRIDTREGMMLASLGDWIIKGVQGEFYPCKPDIFVATYREVK